jgi:hypothetical protein
VSDKKKRPDEFPQTSILRSNPGQLKDCWIENKDGEVILKIRQVSFFEKAGESHTKTIILVNEEIQGLVDTIAKATGWQQPA